jgi:hypothetical protein
VNIVGERLERRHVDHLGGIGERACDALTDQIVDRGKKRGQGLAGAFFRRPS